MTAAYVRDWLLRDPLADLGDIAAEMLRTCLQRNSRDNMTCMILQFDDGSDWSNFPDEMKNYEKPNPQMDLHRLTSRDEMLPLKLTDWEIA
ncbi:unnamed protein product [Effrenium voratum]|uniref:Uncharacterized protein n=1 Tax=Effrenium voratum TaxID=2562239 RepID=A0AA36N6V1_9DINO|nr:unnamed protein product [Effrenium voratum]